MSPGTDWRLQNILDWVKLYCEYQEIPWWKFRERGEAKRLLDWCYPLVKSHLKNYTKSL